MIDSSLLRQDEVLSFSDFSSEGLRSNGPCTLKNLFFFFPSHHLRNLKENHQTLNDIRMSDNTTLAPPASNQGPTTPRKGPPKFKQRQTRQFKSKPPKKGVKG